MPIWAWPAATLRAAERTVQLLHQVSGRAGRAEAPGRVLLQTAAPMHPVMQALAEGDLAAFYERESEARRPGNWPPYGRLAALIVSADTQPAADACAQALGRTAPLRRRACLCWARRRRRWPSCAAATAAACC